MLFESASALSLSGFSLGETMRLTIAGKIVIIVAIIAGRLGPLALLMKMTQDPRGQEDFAGDVLVP